VNRALIWNRTNGCFDCEIVNDIEENVIIMNKIVGLIAMFWVGIFSPAVQAESIGGDSAAQDVARVESTETATKKTAEDDDGLGDAELQAVGCAVVAGAGLAATVAAGPSEVIMLWGGGMLIPSHAATLWLTLFTQIGVSGCALGAIATPTVMWAADQSDNILAKIGQSLGLAPHKPVKVADSIPPKS
jgi:hypothetical protein